MEQVCIDHGHPGESASEGDSPVGHCVYSEVVLECGRGAGGLPAQGEVDR